MILADNDDNDKNFSRTNYPFDSSHGQRILFLLDIRKQLYELEEYLLQHIFARQYKDY